MPQLKNGIYGGEKGRVGDIVSHSLFFLPPRPSSPPPFFCLRLFSGPSFPSPLLLSCKKEDKEKKKRVVPFSLPFFADEKPHYLGHLIFIAPVALFFCVCVCAACCVSLRVPRTLGFVLIIFPPLLRQRSEQAKEFPLLSLVPFQRGDSDCWKGEEGKNLENENFLLPSLSSFSLFPPFSSCRQRALRQWNKDKRIIFPGKTVSSLFFGLTEPSEKFVSSHGCFCLVNCTAHCFNKKLYLGKPQDLFLFLFFKASWNCFL